MNVESHTTPYHWTEQRAYINQLGDYKTDNETSVILK